VGSAELLADVVADPDEDLRDPLRDPRLDLDLDLGLCGLGGLGGRPFAARFSASSVILIFDRLLVSQEVTVASDLPILEPDLSLSQSHAYKLGNLGSSCRVWLGIGVEKLEQDM
jgi:hypothetical protein